MKIVLCSIFSWTKFIIWLQVFWHEITNPSTWTGLTQIEELYVSGGLLADMAKGDSPVSSSSSLLLSSLELSDTKVYEPKIQALFGTALQFCDSPVSKTPHFTLLLTLETTQGQIDGFFSQIQFIR